VTTRVLPDHTLEDRDSVVDTVAETTREGDSAGFVEVTDRIARPRQLPEGARVDRYVILSHLGSGGMGSVYAAWDPRLGRRVAIKLLHAGPWSTERHALRLEREARTLGRLNHENVVHVFDVGEWEGKPFLTMEFVDGKDLVAFITEERPSREAIVRLFMQAGRGLVAAHALGVVHRDVKGENIFVGADGRARIGDFGIARLASETTGDVPPPGSPAVADELTLRKPVTLDGVIVGTPKFMGPEQLEGGRVDARSDQFSLCVALWIAVFGEDPFPASSTLLARFERMHAPPQTPTKRWPALEVVVTRGLAFDAAGRYADMAALLRALDRVLGRPRRLGAAAVFTIVALASALGTIALLRRDPCGLRAARASVDASLASASAPLLGHALAPWLDRWSTTATAMCGRADIDEVARAARLDCFEVRRRDVASLVELVARARASEDAALQAALALPLPETCLEARHVVSRSVAQLARLSEARMALAAGELAAAQQAAAAVLGSVDAADDERLRAEGALLLGQVQMQQGAFADSEATLREALRAAMASSSMYIEAKAWLSLVEVVGDRLKHRDEAVAMLPLMEAAVSRFADDNDLQVERLIAEAYIANETGQPAAGERAAGAAVALALRRLPVNPHALGRAANLQAILLTQLGETARAVRVLRQGRDELQKLLPPQHIRFVSLNNSLGLALQRDHDLRGARDAFEAAVAVIEAQPHPTDHAAIHGVPLGNIAMLDLLAGDTAQATKTALRARALLIGAVGESGNRVSWVDEVLALAAATDGRFADAHRFADSWRRRHESDAGGWMHIRALVLDASITAEEKPTSRGLRGAAVRLAALQPKTESGRASVAAARAALAFAAGDRDSARQFVDVAAGEHLEQHGTNDERELIIAVRDLLERSDASAVPRHAPMGRVLLREHRARH
jgi:hypothetical protein